MSEPPPAVREGSAAGARPEPSTERANERSAELDRLSTAAALALFQAEDEAAVRALRAAADATARAVELVARRLSRGGRLIYVGAGTSGRLGVLDAVECPPTFGSDPAAVVGWIAGGPEALVRSVEGAEDDRAAGRRRVDEGEVEPRDVVFGITASGRAPFVRGALERARERGAATVLLACVPFDEAPDDADVSIRVPTGPEVLAGSTRLKAGTVTKLVLNRVTTLAMTRLGKVHGNRMVDVDTRANAKLHRRGVRMIVELFGLDDAEAERCLGRAGGSVKLAAVMRAHGLEADAAAAHLAAAAGRLREALETPPRG